MFMKINWVLDLHMIHMFPGRHGEVKILSEITLNNNFGMFSLYFKTLIELSWTTMFINIIIMLLFSLVWWLFCFIFLIEMLTIHYFMLNFQTAFFQQPSIKVRISPSEQRFKNLKFWQNKIRIGQTHILLVHLLDQY